MDKKERNYTIMEKFGNHNPKYSDICGVCHQSYSEHDTFDVGCPNNAMFNFKKNEYTINLAKPYISPDMSFKKRWLPPLIISGVALVGVFIAIPFHPHPFIAIPIAWIAFSILTTVTYIMIYWE
jgi:hypothetical protein